MPKELSLNRPMSHTAPYFISVLRILFTLSFTEDVVIFSDEITQETKGSSLLCPSTLSTCAYQIAYGFNDLAKAIQDVVSKIAKKSYKKSYDCSATTQKYEVVPEAESEDEEEKPQHQLFEDSNNSESPLKDIAKIIELHQKSITELEDFVQIIIKQMRANSPTVNSVKISLQIKAEQEKQKLQRKKLAKIDHQELQKICKIIQKNDEQICPTSGDLYAVSSNRDQQNHAFEIVEKILQDFGDECVYADIAKLLSHCLQVSHCSLMHWMFAFELFKAMEYDEKVAATGKTVFDHEQKQFAAIQIYRCLKIWDTVSLAVPFYVNLDDNLNENVNDIWKIMKDKIIAAQYALEICYNNQKRAA
uniref:Uncharacterized protein n=1 Tax=Panagrolaimus davidi TaxID=227884 RepID=A0A914PSR0_9BILA